jgi:hypothetical protein
VIILVSLNWGDLRLEKYLGIICRKPENYVIPRKFKTSQYLLKNTSQEQLVVLFENNLGKGLLGPLHKTPTNKIDEANDELVSALDHVAKQMKNLCALYHDEPLYSERFDMILEERSASIFCAFVEAHDYSVVGKAYTEIYDEDLYESEKKKVMTWDQYKSKHYESFFNSIKKMLPDKHRKFYNKRIHEKLNKKSNVKVKQNNTPSSPAVRPRTDNSRQSPPPANEKPTSSPKRKKVKRRQSTSNDANTEVPSVPPPEVSIKEDTGIIPEKPRVNDEVDGGNSANVSIESSTIDPLEVAVPEIQKEAPEKPKEPLLENMQRGAEILTPPSNDVNTEVPSVPPPKVSIKEKTVISPEKPRVKDEVDGGNSANVSIESGTIDPLEVVVPEIQKAAPAKPKETLLEKMQREAKERESNSKQNNEKPKHKEKIPIEYPVVFNHSRWVKLWSNASIKPNRGWMNYSWNCASIGKSYLMEESSRDKLKRNLDFNQDFAIVKNTRKTLTVLMFDGVSQSRAPRQWAEFLADLYVKNNMNINKLKKHSAEVEQWHESSVEKWEDWIEKEYLPRRTHLPNWRLKNEVKSSHTTFIAIEINSKEINVACIGDSAIFCKKKSGEINSLPKTYNHALRPKNISTKSLYKSDEIDYLSMPLDELESVLACTDSIADYIIDEDPKIFPKKLAESIQELSIGGDRFEYMVNMIQKGPSNGGWLEDDVSFFSLIQNKHPGGEVE